ncbi:50S ribosomal protein L10 [Candidatus Pantoea edessiphila]|uniref:Large ribosomal subunit protein uL10 n=1 Tax=Candidatus Pantoea edessiphila TaxID=2044610 RepID=A0A2P5SYF9_9GAMM|nr:50S ribosomal protein L10 [Candidatus Pantoea edessiphila]MBK4775547.1 50S ribosomal protein L10 [Pantoea sp. Edef]PPI87330.1 50S ribosomal protein L10 [Candidatus Pantoea edessiphila]
MPLNLKDKKEIVAKICQIAEQSISAVVADFRGVTVDKITELRAKGRKSGVYISVVRNTLLHRIVKNTQFECLNKTFIGPTLIAYSTEHPGIAARLLKEFEKDNITFKIKAAAFENKFIDADNIDLLANLPTYEESIINLMLTIKEAAAGKIVRVLKAISDIKKN